MRIRHFLVLSAVTLSVAFGPPERTTPAKWALVVGISDYTHFGDEIGGERAGPSAPRITRGRTFLAPSPRDQRTAGLQPGKHA